MCAAGRLELGKVVRYYFVVACIVEIFIFVVVKVVEADPLSHGQAVAYYVIVL